MFKNTVWMKFDLKIKKGYLNLNIFLRRVVGRVGRSGIKIIKKNNNVRFINDLEIMKGTRTL